MCGNIVADYYKNIWLEEKDIFMKLYFWITFSSFCMVAAFAAGNLADYGIISMCRGLKVWFGLVPL